MMMRDLLTGLGILFAATTGSLLVVAGLVAAVVWPIALAVRWVIS